MKIMYIMRGPSGCGKSTHALELKKGGEIFSTDEFWGNSYNFQPAKLSEAHQWNQLRTLRAMVRGVTPVIIDNTNIQCQAMLPYVEDAIACGYKIEIVEPRNSWAFDINVLMEKNTHQTPLETIKRMIEKYEKDVTIEKILAYRK